MADDAPVGSLVDWTRAVWHRRKWLALPALVYPLAAALGLTASLPEVYQSSATVLVERQEVPESFVQSTVTSALETRLQTISQEILSRPRLRALITRFDLYPELRDHAPAEAVVARVRGDIGVKLQAVRQHVRGDATVAFTISYRGRQPHKVAQVANALASFYVEENWRMRERLAAGTADFLKAQLEETTRRLEAQEQRVSEFKSRYLGELPEQLAANLATLERMNTQLRLNNDSQTRVLERRGALVQQLPGAGEGAPADGPEAAVARLIRMQQELETLRAAYKEKYPDVVRLKAEIAALEHQLATAPPDSGSERPREMTAVGTHAFRLRQALAEVDGELKALKAEEQSLRAAIAHYHQRVENTPRREQEFQELSRDYQSTKELYARLLKRYEEAQLAETLEQRQKGEQFRIVDPALPSQQPAWPNRPRLALLGLFLSLGLMAGVVVLAEQLDDTLHSVDALRVVTSAPVLASIPRIVTAADAGRRRRRVWLGLGGGLVGLVVVGAVSYVAGADDQLVWLLMRRTF